MIPSPFAQGNSECSINFHSRELFSTFKVTIKIIIIRRRRRSEREGFRWHFKSSVGEEKKAVVFGNSYRTVANSRACFPSTTVEEGRKGKEQTPLPFPSPQFAVIRTTRALRGLRVGTSREDNRQRAEGRNRDFVPDRGILGNKLILGSHGTGQSWPLTRVQPIVAQRVSTCWIRISLLSFTRPQGAGPHVL